MHINLLKKKNAHVLISTIWVVDGKKNSDGGGYIFIPYTDIKFNYSNVYTFLEHIDHFGNNDESHVDNFFTQYIDFKYDIIELVNILYKTDDEYIIHKDKQFWRNGNQMYNSDKDLMPIVYTFDNVKDFAKAKMILNDYCIP